MGERTGEVVSALRAQLEAIEAAIEAVSEPLTRTQRRRAIRPPQGFADAVAAMGEAAKRAPEIAAAAGFDAAAVAEQLDEARELLPLVARLEGLLRTVHDTRLARLDAAYRGALPLYRTANALAPTDGRMEAIAAPLRRLFSGGGSDDGGDDGEDGGPGGGRGPTPAQSPRRGRGDVDPEAPGAHTGAAAPRTALAPTCAEPGGPCPQPPRSPRHSHAEHSAEAQRPGLVRCSTRPLKAIPPSPGRLGGCDGRTQSGTTRHSRPHRARPHSVAQRCGEGQPVPNAAAHPPSVQG